MQPAWEPIFVLPNLTLKAAVETVYVAIAPGDDPRVVDLRGQYPAVDRLMGAFVDHLKHPVEPAVLLVRADAPASAKTRDALVALRNVVALSATLYGWTFIRDRGAPQHTVWTGHFNFYPVTIHDDDSLVTYSTALMGIWSAEDEFLAMPAPNLPSFLTPAYDRPLLQLLLTQWTKRFARPGEETRKARKLFRSLEMAYQACQSPDTNLGSMYEWGTGMALWIGAFESLFHPGGNKSVSVKIVSGELGKYHWPYKRLITPRFKLMTSKQRRSKPQPQQNPTGARASKSKPDMGNLAQRLYYRLYDARNAFMHGNPVRVSTLQPFGGKGPSLAGLAPVLYRSALVVYLNPVAMQRHPNGMPPRVKTGDSLEWGFANERYARALLDPLREHGTPR